VLTGEIQVAGNLGVDQTCACRLYLEQSPPVRSSAFDRDCPVRDLSLSPAVFRRTSVKVFMCPFGARDPAKRRCPKSGTAAITARRADVARVSCSSCPRMPAAGMSLAGAQPSESIALPPMRRP
jgi:hypothetical protein